MPTPTMPDEDLDSLFWRVAQAYPDAGPPAGAWERLESQLDVAAATQQLRWKVARIFAVEVAVLLLLTWQGYLLVQRRTPLAARLPYAAQPAALAPAGQPALAPARPVGPARPTSTTSPTS